MRFFTENPLPVFDALSPASKRALESYLGTGNSAFRTQRLLDFFKMIDWLAPDESCDLRPLHKLPPAVQKQVGREIEDYRMAKAVKRVENSEKREEYRLRIFEYFRIKMPRADKALLESLRDFELDLTGRDVNWRHHFTLDSFKKIDAFMQADHAERMQRIAAFRKDVETYKKNYDRIHNPHYFTTPGCDHSFTFDDWCNAVGEKDFRKRQNSHQAGGHERQADEERRSASGRSAEENAVFQAFRTLQGPWGSDEMVVKRQFRQLTLTHHPDVPGGSEEKMKSIIAAYHDVQRFWKASRHAHAQA